MGLLWGSVYSLLCVETVFLTLLLLPLISTQVWCRVFASLSFLYNWLDRLLSITWYFWVLFGLLSVLFTSTLKEMWKYEKVRQDHKEGVHGIDGLTREVDKTNLFRSQRNVYIVGLTLFLALVIKRVLALILTLGNLRNEHAELKKKVQAQDDKKDD
eukprot:TRINITY_DN1626_c0_g1_i1.p1 TRINITY_DN1626_c0_g1~~TRINITY_DN1626_c0_g1_i1.p1  ORF type:complete len:157 (-),score=33.03 TRINITY_DN1626_c0_g1_i1:356-826(-)